MRKWLLALALAAVALSAVPKGTDIGQLLPVELVQIELENGIFLIRTDTGHQGRGMGLAEAMEDLRRKAPGVIFLETTEYVLLTLDVSGCLAELQNWFRPGTQVYRAEKWEDLEQAAAYLNAHSLQAPLYRQVRGWQEMPELKAEGENLTFESEES